jgi:hypothetical protein
MNYMDAVADLFCFEPEDDLTKKSIAEFMKNLIRATTRLRLNLKMADLR